ncbi:MAG: nicotinamide-nucleotide amidohydrolase family protein [Candidatus Krumholzibacteriota bacterium]|nr:nicotinamide-nucleotide amidohydrolase family protein [Candidatus Krumholzibacteriota bacterium]
MRIEIITIGNEVLRNETSENNGAYLSSSLTAIGSEPSRITILPDDRGTIRTELEAASKRSDVVIVTGGLGPTVDDVTRLAAIDLAGGRTDISDEITDSIAEKFGERQQAVPKGYIDLARIPAGAKVLPNKVGAAPGLAMKAGESEIYMLPGVPAEMRSIFQASVLPGLTGQDNDIKRVISIFGMMETTAEEILSRVVDSRSMEKISIIAGPDGIRLYLPSKSIGEDQIERLRDEFGSYIFSIASERLEEVVLRMLASSGATLSTAESLTGGLIASTLVSVPGASGSFIEGFITYSNDAKVDRLGVERSLIESFGAVSEEVCVSMAEGAIRVSGSDMALSTTGIAGPGGATGQKPVGLCYLGLAAGSDIFCREIRVAGDREMVRKRCVCTALDMLRLFLSGKEERLAEYRIATDGAAGFNGESTGK